MAGGFVYGENRNPVLSVICYNRYMKKTTTGFSLIELLVSIAIIAILTAIITANFTSAKAKSRDAKRVSDIAQLQLALELYFDRCNQYPIVSSALPSLTDTSCAGGIAFSTYLSRIPTPPTSVSGDVYTYAVNGTPATDYVLRAKLETTSALSDDSDGTLQTIDCEDAGLYYCVQPK